MVSLDVRTRKLRHLAVLCVVALAATLLLFHLRADLSEKILAVIPHLPSSRPQESSEFFDWKTLSQFKPVNQDVENKSIADLCEAFPKHLLRDIQPVLKTGHGLLETRARPNLQSVSACLENILIFSDIDEAFDGHLVIDVIADLSANFKHNNSQLNDYFIQKGLADQGTLGPGNSAQIKGWELDKFKFLTQVSRVWRMRPERQWYVFYESDTYVVWDNLFRLLANWDPDESLYFGSPSPGPQGSWMANGGPGYVLSREAVRRLVWKDYDPSGTFVGSQLSARWEYEMTHDCCGDSVLGWAVHEDANTTLSGLWPSFQPHPLHGIPFSDLYWCQPVLTMHKTMTEDMARLWRWEESRRDLHRPLLYAHLADFLNLTQIHMREDWINSDFDGYPPPPSAAAAAHASFDGCGRACTADDACFQWTYHLRICSFVRSFRLGQSASPGIEMWRPDDVKAAQWEAEDLRFTAGWDLEGIRRWMALRDCGTVAWVRPSLTRIF